MNLLLSAGTSQFSYCPRRQRPHSEPGDGASWAGQPPGSLPGLLTESVTNHFGIVVDWQSHQFDHKWETSEQQPIINVITLLFGGWSGDVIHLTNGLTKGLAFGVSFPPSLPLQNELPLDKYKIFSSQKRLLSQQAPARLGDSR